MTPMLSQLKNLKLDPLIGLIITAVILAVLFPARGQFAHYFSIATNIGIGLLFFLYGARLSPSEALAGLKHWRLHLTILAFTFVFFPVLGLLLKPMEYATSHELYLGILYLCLVPSTVQSSVAFTSIARGNIAGAIVSASASNLIGVIATPILVMLLMSSGTGVQVDSSVFINIATQLLLPFALGQLLRKWVGDFAAKKGTKIVDRGSIAMVVYSAFSAGMVQGIWSRVSFLDLVTLTVLSIAMVAFMLWFTKFVAERLRFDRPDVIAIEFCGTKKSLATGLPMAAVIFGGAKVGILILPLMIFHQVQLMMCATLASRYAQQGPARSRGVGPTAQPSH